MIIPNQSGTYAVFAMDTSISPLLVESTKVRRLPVIAWQEYVNSNLELVVVGLVALSDIVSNAEDHIYFLGYDVPGTTSATKWEELAEKKLKEGAAQL